MLQDHQIKTKLSKFKALCICSRCASDFECNFYEAKKSRVGHLCRPCKERLISLRNPTQNDLLELFHYDEMTGMLTHKLDTLRSSAGDVATYPHSQGYLSVLIGGKEYLAHRVIWFMKTGQWPDQVDHEDHDRSNNRWGNLRDIAGRDNQKNMSKKRSNSSGVTGVRILPSGKFSAYITVNRKQIQLGSYPEMEKAIQARKGAELRYGFHVNHGE